MRALTYTRAHELKNFDIRETEIPSPEPRDTDLVVEVKAFSVNPVDYKVRSSRSASDNKPVILGWDAAGVVVHAGPSTQGFKTGDAVFYAGDLARDGSNAELQAVDYRIVAPKPRSLGFAESAALPLTTLTAWEALIERRNLDGATVLVVGGAGGVGSIAIQILKAKTSARVVATASRPETVDWCRGLGADVVVNHSKGLETALRENGIEEVEVVFSTTHSDKHLDVFPRIISPFGYLVLIDDPASLDISGFKRKSIAVGWELMFTKTLYHHRPESQGRILGELAELVDAGKIVTTARTVWKGFTSENLRHAHELLESSRSIGKIVLER